MEEPLISRDEERCLETFLQPHPLGLGGRLGDNSSVRPHDSILLSRLIRSRRHRFIVIDNDEGFLRCTTMEHHGESRLGDLHQIPAGRHSSLHTHG